MPCPLPFTPPLLNLLHNQLPPPPMLMQPQESSSFLKSLKNRQFAFLKGKFKDHVNATGVLEALVLNSAQRFFKRKLQSPLCSWEYANDVARPPCSAGEGWVSSRIPAGLPGNGNRARRGARALSPHPGAQAEVQGWAMQAPGLASCCPSRCALRAPLLSLASAVCGFLCVLQLLHTLPRKPEVFFLAELDFGGLRFFWCLEIF